MTEGRFRLLECVATAPHGELWRARDAGGRAVALKLGLDAGARARFAAEARVLALGLSRRMPALFDVGFLALDGERAFAVEVEAAQRGSLPFLALEWVAGLSLDTAVRGADPAVDLERLAWQVAHDVGEALADLHALGIAHGDMKPQNLMVEGGGRVRLVDLGLACPLGAREPCGGTPRYLGLGDRDLGDARARDLLALGIVLAELALPELGARADVLAAAREAPLPEPLASVCRALLHCEPGARPPARSVCDTAAPHVPCDDGGARHVARVRATYLRLRWHDIERAEDTRGRVAPWLAAAVQFSRRARALGLPAATGAPGGAWTESRATGAGAEEPRGYPALASLAPLAPEDRQRWLVSLVGSAAAGWPMSALGSIEEETLARALEALAARRAPELWTWRDLEGALAGSDAAVAPAPQALALPLDAERAAELACRLGRVPVDRDAVAVIERLGAAAPDALALAAADALRLAGELGRAIQLCSGRPRGGAIVADAWRRAGDLERAVDVARTALGDDPHGRARACLARALLDLGREGEAADACATVESAPVAEVAALVAARAGDRARALALVERGLALARDDEERARLWATAAYLESSEHPDAARAGYRTAVEHAVRAGAVLEEASYRTGEAAACVDGGELETGLASARRAALLWAHALGRPSMAARAELACAAAEGCSGSDRAALEHAARAARLGAEGGDVRAQAFAALCVADVTAAGDPRGLSAARFARSLLAPASGSRDPSLAAGDALGDDLATAARVARHEPTALDAAERRRLDALARPGSHLPVETRLAWWQARAEELLGAAAGDSAEGRAVLAALTALAGCAAPVAARGTAMHAGARLAARLGDTAALARLEAVRREVAARVLSGLGSDAAQAARRTPWLAGASPEDGTPVGEPSVELRELVRALGERRRLGLLLDRVLDVLLSWTGAERGLMLLRNPRGVLVPRAARNIARDHLARDQIALSQSLAERALATGEPVVAVDAMHELGTSHESAHALQLRSVLALPLAARGEVVGVAYLDDRMRAGTFGAREVAWAQAVAPVAALAISDAMTEVRLRRAVRRAERTRLELEELLAQKETALDVAERELARTVGHRPTRHRYPEIVGESEPVRRMLAVVDRVAGTDVPVLLRGESGSGKELVARALHRHGARAGHPFVSENCGALPETLLESALFGHARGAFTGAYAARVGLFEAAHGGTLFLDEIGEMSLGMQTKLLRVLEDGLVRPVGSERARRVDVRIVAATHRDLERLVAEERFRQDLYYRLDVISIAIPSLRERPTDIPLLVAHLVQKHAGRPIEVTPAALARLQEQPWPGNVRQLENEIRRALVLCDERIDVAHLSLAPVGEPLELGLDVRLRVDRLEASLLSEALRRTSGNQTQAAKLLGLSRFGLHKMMRRLAVPSGR